MDAAEQDNSQVQTVICGLFTSGSHKSFIPYNLVWVVTDLLCEFVESKIAMSNVVFFILLSTT